MDEGAIFTLNFIESLSMETIVIDEDFHVVGWNTSMEDSTGLKKADALRKDIREFIPAWSKEKPRFARALVGHKPMKTELTIGDLHILVSFKPLKRASGEIYGLIGSADQTLSHDPVFRYLSEGVIRLSDDLEIMYYNQSAETILGRKAAGKKEKRLPKDLPVIGEAVFWAKCKSARQSKKPVAYSESRRHVRIHPVEDGLVVYILPDSQKPVMEDHRAADQRTEGDILNSIGDAVMTTDARGLVTGLNPVAEELTGWKTHEARDHSSGDIFVVRNTKTKALIADPVRPALKSGKASKVADAILTAQDGKNLLIAGSVAPTRKSNGEIIGAVVVFREAGKEYADSRRMEEMEERFRVAFKTSPDAMAISRLADGKYIEVNNAYLTLTGYSAKELIGRTSLEIKLWRNLADRQKMVESLQKDGYIENMDAQFVVKDGTIKIGVVSARVIMLQGEAHLLSVTRDITQKIRLQKELEETNQLIRYILKHDPNAIAVFDRDMNYLMTSDRYLLDYRLNLKDIEGENHYEIFPEIPEKWKTVHRRGLSGLVEKNELDHFIRNDGSKDYVKWEVRPWFKSGGEVGGIIMYTEVITQWVKTEQKVKTRNEFIETILSNLPIGLLVTKISSGKIDYINPKCYDIFDLPRDVEISPDLLYEAIIEDKRHRKQARQMVEESKKKGLFKDLDREYSRIVTRRKNTKIISLFNIPLHEQDLLITVIQDITDKRRAEEERDRLFNFSIDMLFVAGFDGFFKQANPAWEETLGWTEEELFSKPWMDRVYLTDQQASRMAHARLQAGESMMLFENRFLCKDGTYKWLSWNAIPLPDQNLIFGVVRDVTKSKTTEEELKQRNSELNNFVYKVSHDLRAPLSSISGLINLIRIEEPLLSDNQYVSLIENRIMKLDSFIRDILSHSKNLNTEVDVVEVDFKKVIEDCFFELAYLENSSRIDKQISIHGGRFFNDRVRICEIFRNLISNSIKYINPFIDNNKILIDVKVSASHATIKIEDNGIGIPGKHLSKIFEMFFKGSEKSDSSGIGLYIVEQAVKKLKGSIAVESKSNLGSTFIIELPNLKGSPTGIRR